MNALLIDPVRETVEEIELEDDFRAIQQMIGADVFDVFRANADDTFFVDDEGLFKTTQFAWYYHPRYILPVNLTGRVPAVLVNKAVVLSHDESGDSMPPKFNADHYRESIIFLGEKK